MIDIHSFAAAIGVKLSEQQQAMELLTNVSGADYNNRSLTLTTYNNPSLSFPTQVGLFVNACQTDLGVEIQVFIVPMELRP